MVRRRSAAEYITSEGLILIKSDPDITGETVEKLKITEETLVMKSAPDYLYMLDNDHDRYKVYYDEFLRGQETGKAHISQLIREDYGRSMADFCTEYATDRALPFLICVLMLYDLLEYEQTFTEIIPEVMVGKTNFRHAPWMPVKYKKMPPVPYKKLAGANMSSADAVDDGFIIQAYIDGGYTINGLANILGVTRQTAAKYLDNLDISHEIRRSPYKAREFIELVLSDAEWDKKKNPAIPDGMGTELPRIEKKDMNMP